MSSFNGGYFWKRRRMSSSVIFEFWTVVNLLKDMFGLICFIGFFGGDVYNFLRAVKPRKRDWIRTIVVYSFGLFFNVVTIRFLYNFFFFFLVFYFILII